MKSAIFWDTFHKKKTLRCISCRHMVKLHRKSGRGSLIMNGYCKARYCRCNVPLEQLI